MALSFVLRRAALQVYLGKPLAVLFDSSGTVHDNFTHPAFTVRWMASQLQSNHYQNRGYWSWMDAQATAIVTMYKGKPEGRSDWLVACRLRWLP